MAQRVYGGLDTAQRQAQRREQLLEAALERFAEDGWADATVTGICATAGLSRRYLYEQFEDREDLFLAVMDRIADDVEDIVRTSLAEAAEVPPASRARSVLAALVEHFTADPRVVHVALVESLAAPPFRERRRMLVGRFSDLASRLLAAFRDETGTGQPRPERAALVGALLTGGLVELLISWATDGSRVPPEEFVDHVAALAEAAATA